MISWSPRRRSTAGAVAGVALSAALLFTACSPSEEEGTEDAGAEDGEDAGDAMPEPEYDDDDTVQLPVGLVSPEGHNEIAPIDEDGSIIENEQEAAYPGAPEPPSPHQTEIARTSTFGCEDTISVVRTVPMVTEAPTDAALNYLLGVESDEHGEPEFYNPLEHSAEDLDVDSTDVDNGTVTVELSGEPAAGDECESWQVLKQIEATARATSGADNAEVLLEGEPLDEYLNITDDQPLEITEINQD